MQFQGGKGRVGAEIARVLLSVQGVGRYVEPFMGGASVLEKVSPAFGEVVAGDAHEDLALMWQALAMGWDPPGEVTREQYKRERSSPPSALRGFIGYGCSFGGKWWGGYASNARGFNYAGAARRGALRKAAAFRHATIRHADYRQLWIPVEGDLVYCDPPYAGTTGYAATGSFDHETFWETMREWARSGAVVFVSEYTAPSGIEQVWSGRARQSLRKDSNVEPAVERLYRVRG
jgi:DNA adenine methylase